MLVSGLIPRRSGRRSERFLGPLIAAAWTRFRAALYCLVEVRACALSWERIRADDAQAPPDIDVLDALPGCLGSGSTRDLRINPRLADWVLQLSSVVHKTIDWSSAITALTRNGRALFQAERPVVLAANFHGVFWWTLSLQSDALKLARNRCNEQNKDNNNGALHCCGNLHVATSEPKRLYPPVALVPLRAE